MQRFVQSTKKELRFEWHNQFSNAFFLQFQGFLKENSVVWETLNSIDGDGQFVDSEFITAPPKASPKVTSTQDANLSPEQQLEQE